VWFSDGVKYVDYRRPDGRIVTRVADTAVDGYEMYGPDDRLSIGTVRVPVAPVRQEGDTK
jgi:hypothetical protein